MAVDPCTHAVNFKEKTQKQTLVLLEMAGDKKHPFENWQYTSRLKRFDKRFIMGQKSKQHAAVLFILKRLNGFKKRKRHLALFCFLVSSLHVRSDVDRASSTRMQIRTTEALKIHRSP